MFLNNKQLNHLAKPIVFRIVKLILKLDLYKMI